MLREFYIFTFYLREARAVEQKLLILRRATNHELLEVRREAPVVTMCLLTSCQMLLRRVAQTPFLCLIIIWTSTLLAVVEAATTPKISSEILNFVPPCAQACFQSFVQTSFEPSNCGDSPSLACICRQTGKTGFTVGEGGVACISAEASRGTCKGDDGSSECRGKW